MPRSRSQKKDKKMENDITIEQAENNLMFEDQPKAKKNILWRSVVWFGETVNTILNIAAVAFFIFVGILFLLPG